MKKITTIAICSAALASIATAEVAGTFSTGYHSEYLYRGVDLGNGQEMFDFALDFTGDCGCGLTWNSGIWYAATDSEVTANELDFYGSLSKSMEFGGLSGDISVGYIRYTYLNGNSTNAAAGDDGEIFIGASTDYMGVSLGATYYIGEEGASIGQGNPGAGEFGDGQWLDLSAGYGFDVTEALSLSLDLGLGFTFGDAYPDDGLALYSATLGADYALSDDLSLGAYVTNVQSDEDYAGTDHTYYGLSASYSF